MLQNSKRSRPSGRLSCLDRTRRRPRHKTMKPREVYRSPHLHRAARLRAFAPRLTRECLHRRSRNHSEDRKFAEEDSAGKAPRKPPSIVPELFLFLLFAALTSPISHQKREWYYCPVSASQKWSKMLLNQGSGI